jgi:hypothetical protein
MADGPLARLFWRVIDDLDHFLMLARLRVTDAVSAPEQETPAHRDDDGEQNPP